MAGKVDLASVANALRSRSAAWCSAKYEADQIKEVGYQNLTVRRTDAGTLQKVLLSTHTYLKSFVGSLEPLTKEEFIVDYDLRINMDRAAQYGGVECIGLSFKVRWETLPVQVVYYTGELHKVIVPSELQAMIRDQKVKHLTKLAEATGLNFRDVMESDTGRTNQILSVIRACTAGQNKLARLVKGCLLYLDHIGKKDAVYTTQRMEVVEYSVKGLTGALKDRQMAYVFSDMDKDHVSNWILYAMCQAYPNPVMGGCDHISIPQDAKAIILVGFSPEGRSRRIKLTPELIWGTLIHYANCFRLGKDLECALAIACSLRENRYLSAVGLPQVVSGVDLVYPMLTPLMDGVSYIYIPSAKILGRVHQMLVFTLIKDVETSAYHTSGIKRNVNRGVRSILSRDSHTILEYMGDNSVSDILMISSSMDWVHYITDSDLERVRSVSIFESFWLVRNPKEVLQGGIIKCLKNFFQHI